jgi:hypothetical protein
MNGRLYLMRVLAADATGPDWAGKIFSEGFFLPRRLDKTLQLERLRKLMIGA